MHFLRSHTSTAFLYVIYNEVVGGDLRYSILLQYLSLKLCFRGLILEGNKRTNMYILITCCYYCKRGHAKRLASVPGLLSRSIEMEFTSLTRYPFCWTI